MSAVYADPVILWGRVLKRVTVADDGCWLWQGATTSRGYGCVGSGRKGKSLTTHRLAVLVRDGSIPDGMTVDHLCHNASKCDRTTDCPHRRCVNPEHLDVCSGALNAERARHRWMFCSRGHRLATDTRTGATTVTYTTRCACGVSAVRVTPRPTWWDSLVAQLANTT